MFIVWSVLEITFRLGFDRPAQGGWLIFSYSIDALFFLDMVVSMRTALLTNDRMVVAQQKEVALAYLKVSICTICTSYFVCFYLRGVKAYLRCSSTIIEFICRTATVHARVS